MPGTVSVETVQVVRPIKVLAFVCGIISVILLIVAVASNSWVEANRYNQGLWKVCRYQELEGKDVCGTDEASQAWLMACGILVIVSLLVAVVVTILTGVGLWHKDHTLKYKLYRIATFMMFGAFVLALVALIIFPVMFIQGLDEKSMENQIHEWYFAWSYGIGWGGAIFQVGAAILLLIDRDNDEIYYKEKTTTGYHG